MPDPVALRSWGRLTGVLSALLKTRIPGGQHSSDVIRQRKQRPHGNQRPTTRRPPVGASAKVRYQSGYRALPAVRQPDDDQLRSASRAPVADRKGAAIKRMVRVNYRDPSDSPIKLRGIARCSATPR